MNGKYKSLVKNSIIFAAANFGSKALKLLIIPFYTYYLTASQYGTVDMIMTTVSLASPFLMLGMNEAALRFSMKKEYDENAVFINCGFVMCAMSAICYAPCLMFSRISIFQGYWKLFYLLLLATSFESMLLYYARGVDKSFIFASAGILNTVVLLSLNIIFLKYFHAAGEGYLLSILLASAVSCVYLFFSLRLRRTFQWKRIDRGLMKQMLTYSLPLMPNAVMWWIMNASDRYIIVWFMGTSAAGIYAVSNKLPSIMSGFAGVFHQAWQISAVQEYKSDDRERFYTVVFDSFAKSSLTAAAALILFVKPAVVLLVEAEYSDAWKFAPMLLLGAVFSGMSGFMGVNYTVSERTFGAFTTSALGAMINLGLNVILTPYAGMYGTAAATFIGFYVLWLIRTAQTTCYMHLKIDMWGIHRNLFLVILESVMLLSEWKYMYPAMSVTVAVMVLMNRKRNV